MLTEARDRAKALIDQDIEITPQRQADLIEMPRDEAVASLRTAVLGEAFRRSFAL